MNTIKTLAIAAMCAAAQSALADNPAVYVNSEVTTHFVMPENLKLVDISTNELIGNQCTANMLRIKPAPRAEGEAPRADNSFMGTVTLIGERHMAQYDIYYINQPSYAASYYNVTYADTRTYSNPETDMSEAEMSRLAWAAYGSKRKFNNIRAVGTGIRGEVYNIYSAGDYFFIDFVLHNNSKIAYDIDEMRVSLSDMKETKATNFQTVELMPSFVLNPATRFKKNFRQVLVLRKLTYPNEKVLQIEVSEKQISGRVIRLTIDYNDILNADELNMKTIKADYTAQTKANERTLKDEIKRISKINSRLRKNLDDTKKELDATRSEMKGLNKSLDKKKKELDNARSELRTLRRKVVNINASINNLQSEARSLGAEREDCIPGTSERGVANDMASF